MGEIGYGILSVDAPPLLFYVGKDLGVVAVYVRKMHKLLVGDAVRPEYRHNILGRAPHIGIEAA